MIRYVGQLEVATWLGKTYQWLQGVRSGKYTLHEPFPAPDAQVRQGSRIIPLWLPCRRGEIETWYVAYLAQPGKKRGPA